MRTQDEGLEEPGHMRAMPLGRARVGHRLDDLILGRQKSRAALGLGAHGAKLLQPNLPRIGALPAGHGGAVRRPGGDAQQRGSGRSLDLFELDQLEVRLWLGHGASDSKFVRTSRAQ